jgi:thiol-disulfide isomerase/thioredoxin
VPDVTGQSVHLADFQGRETLILFWNPACGFCQRLLPDLKAWEARSPEARARLLVVSTGSVEANMALGLSSPVVLDEDGKIGKQFGASGTPTAVLINAEGTIASELAVGAPAVLALVGSGQHRHQAVPLLG